MKKKSPPKSIVKKLTPAQQYRELGYFIAKTPLKKTLMSIRAKIISVFNEIAIAHNAGKIKNDRDIEKLYHNKATRELWVAAYDQLRYLPEICGLANHPELMKLVKTTGIKFPVLSARPIVRGDMPKDMEFDFPPHQDYPFNQGSLNCVTLWIPFEDIDHKIGPVNIIPGSHLSGNIPTKDGTIKEFDEKKAIEAKAKLGEVVVFSQFMHHRSGKNISKNIRFSLQFRYNDLAHHEYAQRKFYINQKITEKTFDVQHETYFPDAKRK